MSEQKTPNKFGGQCRTCGFQYWEYNGHIIACPVCENAALKVRLRAARSLLAHYANEDVSDPLTKEKIANLVLRICDAVDAP